MPTDSMRSQKSVKANGETLAGYDDFLRDIKMSIHSAQNQAMLVVKSAKALRFSAHNIIWKSGGRIFTWTCCFITSTCGG